MTIITYLNFRPGLSLSDGGWNSDQMKTDYIGEELFSFWSNVKSKLWLLQNHSVASNAAYKIVYVDDIRNISKYADKISISFSAEV